MEHHSNKMTFMRSINQSIVYEPTNKRPLENINSLPFTIVFLYIINANIHYRE